MSSNEKRASEIKRLEQESARRTKELHVQKAANAFLRCVLPPVVHSSMCTSLCAHTVRSVCTHSEFCVYAQ
jgi:hypothetical protein